MAARNPWNGDAREKSFARLSSPVFRGRGHFFLAVFFRVTYNGLSERGITRSLHAHSRITLQVIIAKPYNERSYK